MKTYEDILKLENKISKIWYDRYLTPVEKQDQIKEIEKEIKEIEKLI
jgi:hypothetical protein